MEKLQGLRTQLTEDNSAQMTDLLSDSAVDAESQKLASTPVLTCHIDEAGYETDKPIIRSIYFDVQPGELVGLIGPNGAGKSTTIKSIIHMLSYVKGSVHFGGSNKRYAYVPEQPVLYEYFTLWEHLRLAASVYGIAEQVFEEKAAALLEQFRLSESRDHYPAKFSKGMQQKLMLIIAFLLEPDVYIVDEPFIGLDPRATKELLDILLLEQKRGAGILMSTHVLDTAERICDRFILIDQGAIVAQGTLAQVQKQAGCSSEDSLFDCFITLT